MKERVLLITETDRAYLAGIIDGEGCIGVAYRRVKGKRYITPTLQVNNTRQELLEWLYERYGGGVYHRTDTRPTRKPSWLWSVAGQKALTAIRDAYPYLLLKVDQADIVLAIKRRTVMHGGVKRMTEADFVENDNVVKLIHALNKRGV
jgi:hypothetical protein